MTAQSERPSPPRVLIAAFEGWSDAGAATTTVLEHLAELMGAEPLYAIGAEGYIDFQVHRPKVSRDESGKRVIDWPDTKLYGEVQRPALDALRAELPEHDFLEAEESASDKTIAVSDAQSEDHTPSQPQGDAHSPVADEENNGASAEGSQRPRDGEHPAASEQSSAKPETVRRIDGSRVTDLFLLAGVEPARDWSSFADEVVELVDVWAIDKVVILGSLFSDAPHSRPIVTTLSSDAPELHEDLGAEKSSYEGPVGITTIIDLALAEAGIETVSLWAQVPHYVHSTPSPKVTLALLDKLEELLDIVIPRGDLLTEATEWESNINRIAASDEDMTRYIRGLEETRDARMAAETTGAALAFEFEKYLGAEAEHRPDLEVPPMVPGTTAIEHLNTHDGDSLSETESSDQMMQSSDDREATEAVTLPETDADAATPPAVADDDSDEGRADGASADGEVPPSS